MYSHTPASLFLAATLSAGIAMASLLKPEASTCLLALGCSAGLLWLFKNRAPGALFWTCAGLLSISLGMWTMARTLPENRPRHYAHSENRHAGPAQVRILEELRHNAFAFRYLGEVTGLGGRPAEGRVLLEMRRDSVALPLRIGQELLSPIPPEPLRAPGNPGQFDYRQYLQGIGVHGRLSLNPSAVVQLESQKGGFSFFVKDIRGALLSALEHTGLDEAELGIAKALLLGDRTRVEPDLYASYRKAGALHLLAVSGLHVGILAAFLYALLRPLQNFRYGRQLRFLLGTSLLWGYALLCGFSPSVVRAVILFSFVSYALYVQRPGQTLHFLALAWIFMLVLINPAWLLQVGFQLSFAAVAALVVFTPVLFKRCPWKGTVGNYVGRLTCASLAAQIGTLPLTLFYFHQFPGVFLLSNLAILPGIGVLLIMGFACLFLQVLGLLPTLLISCYGHLLSLMNAFIRWSGGLDGFYLEGIPWDAFQLFLSGVALILFGVYFQRGSRQWRNAAAFVLIWLPIWSFTVRIGHLNTNALIVPHKVKAGGFWVREGTRLQVFSGEDLPMRSLIRDAETVWHLDSIRQNPIPPHSKLGPFTLRVLDRSALYSPREPSPDFLLLCDSPRIHLERLLEALRPGQVIADGSNYKSLVSRWKKSCEKRGIPFHDTTSEGAFIRQIRPANP
ncbi:MAG: ComEC/Rec2 family competence protein [Robiginitalea sp.]|nr:ComEC/Rec2 family competence protein [Robiginitalea sp.]